MCLAFSETVGTLFSISSVFPAPSTQKRLSSVWGVSACGSLGLGASGLAVLMCLVSAPFAWFTDLDLAVPETVRLDSSLHKARAQLLAKGRRHRPSRSRLRDSASSAEEGEGSDGPGGKVGTTLPITHTLPTLLPPDNPSKPFSRETTLPDF